MVPAPSLDSSPSDPSNSSSLEQRQLTWAYRFLLAIEKEANYVNAAIGLGGAAGGVVLNYLPLSPLYLVVTAPFLLLGMLFGCGAIAKSIEKKVRARRRDRRNSVEALAEASLGQPARRGVEKPRSGHVGSLAPRARLAPDSARRAPRVLATRTRT